ncbi:helix-turn-helix domain-containing protein, partial [Streptococcus agalactiae]|nr:helix-turn-helix domain-containing protein [Streptococcus agalactiae]
MNKIPNRIKELRKQKGVTLNDLSLATGFTTSSISRWEEGSRGFDKEKAILMAKILEVKPSELFISDENNFQTYW